MKVVIDAAGGTGGAGRGGASPVIVYTQDLTSLGWPLDPQILTDLRNGQ